VEIGNGDVSPDFIIDLELMELGQSPATADRPPQPGWASRTLGLRDDANLGPFRLAFLEALLRVADWRGSSVK
jgi:CRISPR-associated endonuclease/helicase Cas3